MSEDATHSIDPPAGDRGLLSASFLGLLFTQLFTAINDNILRWLVIGIGKDYVDEANVGGILAAGTACFVLPYLLLAAPAGYLADRFSKTRVIVACKLGEIVIVSLAIAAIGSQRIELLFLAVALMGAQSALFSPAKLGIIPELLPVERISAANGLFGLATVSATVIGMGLGTWLSDATGYRGTQGLWLSASVLLSVAVIGTALSLRIRLMPAANPAQRFPWNAAAATYRELRTLAANRPLLRVALGIAFFWSIGALAQLNIDQFAAEGGAFNEAAKNPLLFALVLGLGLGSILAGRWSGGRVELGILPLGALGIAVTAMALFAVQGAIIAPDASRTAAFFVACGLLFLLGGSAGLFDVPLESYLQHRSPAGSRGAVLAASNFLTFSGMLFAALLYYLLRAPIRGDAPLFTARQIFLLAGLATLPVCVYIVWLIPQASIRFLVWLASRTVYRVRIGGRENLPEVGGALLVANHVSWIDGVLLLLSSSRPIRMIVWSGNFQSRWMRGLAGLWGVILISQRPKEIVAALRTARDAIDNGELVCIFPEGEITRSGQLLGFRPGLLRILDGTSAPVLPVYLDGLWGSIFSFERGRFFWKWPRQWPYPIFIEFGAPFPNPGEIQLVRRAVQELGAQAVARRHRRSSVLLSGFVKTCARQRRQSKVVDSTGQELTGGQLLARTLALRSWMRRGGLDDSEQYVGLLLPPSAGGMIANLALALDRRVSVNLNYTATSAILNECIRQAGLRRVLTSRAFLARTGLELAAECIYLEDVAPQIQRTDRWLSALQAYLLPARWLTRLLGVPAVQGDDLLTVIFTSGSTGHPKGVMLTHANVGSNVEAVEQIIRINRQDVLLGVLPFFHAFGYTITLWTVATIRSKGVYHYNPLDAKTVGKLCRERQATVLVSTPTFLRMYLRRCDEEDLKTLEVVVTGAERLPKDLSDAFEAKYGVRPVEGYGATELSPLASANIPPSRTPPSTQPEYREGAVGRPVPGVAAKVVDPETGQELGAGQPGMLLIAGANVMRGYLGRDDLTAQVLRDGWYVTGDIAAIDEGGFLQIRGRLSRFSKIGGEMVPHGRIEDAISQLVGLNDDGSPRVAVTGVADAKRGERLVVIHTPWNRDPGELTRALAEDGLPNLYIPAPDAFYEVDQLPVLGTGKLDLQNIQQLAEERSAVQVPPSANE